MCKCKSLQAGQLSQEHFHYHKTSEARSWWQLKPVVEIIVGHLSWPTRFPIWPSNVFEMVEEMNRKKFVHWILSLHTTKLYDPKLIHFATIVSALTMCHLLPVSQLSSQFVNLWVYSLYIFTNKN